jgi:hypothetical protein
MEVDWLIEAAHAAGGAVYGRMQPWARGGELASAGYDSRIYASPVTMRAAGSNYLRMGCDGLYTHSLQWPLRQAQTDLLRDLAGGLGRLDLLPRHYCLPRRDESSDAAAFGYDQPIPRAVAVGVGLRRIESKSPGLGQNRTPTCDFIIYYQNTTTCGCYYNTRTKYDLSGI